MTTTAIEPSASPAPRTGNVDDDTYHRFLQGIQERFVSRVGLGRLFTTDADDLWETYLASFPPGGRQFHNCHSCRRFIETYGGLVTVGEDGAHSPAVWTAAEADREEAAAVAAMERIVRRAKVNGVFLSSATIWGFPLTGVWRHMSLIPPKHLVYSGRALTAGQAMAEKSEDFKNISRALVEYEATVVHQALALLKSEALYRSEKVLGPCQFLADLHAAIEAAPGRRANVIWRAVATAPAGFCHPRSSMIGTLLDDIVSGLSFDEAARKFRLKMDPLQYQRPQAAPSAGNIAAAEKLVERLGIGPALVRRFARLEEVETIWKPAPTQEPKSPGAGVFAHLKPKDVAPPPSMMAPPQTMTWVKFASSVLPDAVALEVLAPSHGNYTAILTANDPAAPPILQWDSPERRNPFSTYVYVNGSPASQWGVSAESWARVTGVANQPHQWFGAKLAHQAPGVVLILEGAKDYRKSSGNAIFPETLKSELHGIRSTVEAYSRSAEILGRDEASACGLSVRGSGDLRLRATDRYGVRSEFRIDRYE